MESKGTKRPHPSEGESNPRPQKSPYEKRRHARVIAVQSSSQALSSGSIDVNAFTSSRSFEINALQNAMRGSVLNQRAFQDVPRTLRRRSASHNVKRVPKPLRAKAKWEMVVNKTKPVHSKVRGRKRLRMEKRRLEGKSKPADETTEEMQVDDISEERGNIPKLKPRKVVTGKYAKRQEDKTWLPTHLYHAKRARMEHRYGFSLPITPTEKSFRPTYRASHHAGFIAFDTSYLSTFFLHGAESSLSQLLNMIIEPDSAAAGKRYSSGKRSCEAILYHHDQFPRGMIGPALLLWDPKPESGEIRQLMVRVHPSIAEEVWDEIHICARKVQGDIKIEDARFEIGAIDLFGPTSTEALFAILKPGKGTSEKLWNELRGLTSPGNLPIGAVLDFDLCDPRIEFPPRKIKYSASAELNSLLQQWPSTLPSSSSLFTSSIRSNATKYLSTHTRGSLQKARHDLLSAGKPPTLPPSEALIPSLLLRRDTSSWTLLLPWSWVGEFWYSFMNYPQSRFGGVTEMGQILFELGELECPRDWSGTRAGEGESERMGKEEKEKWERRPKGKRESWGKVVKGGEIGDPFKCDWKFLFTQREKLEAVEKERDQEERETEMDPIERIKQQAKAAMEDDAMQDNGDHDVEEKISPFLLSPNYAMKLLRSGSPLMVTSDLSHALLSVRLHFLRGGNVDFRARIYRLPLDLQQRRGWTDLTGKDAIKPSKSEYPDCPGEPDLIGFVTSGNQSLSEGRCRAIGALSWPKVEEEEERWREEKQFARWCIIRDVGNDIGRLAKWELKA